MLDDAVLALIATYWVCVWRGVVEQVHSKTTTGSIKDNSAGHGAGIQRCYRFLTSRLIY